MKLIRIKESASYYKGKTAKYDGEITYPNGRHAVCAVIMNGSNHDCHGGFPIEMDIADVELLFPDSERDITNRALHP